MARNASFALEASVDDKASKPLSEIGGSAANTAEKITALESAAALLSRAWGAIEGMVGGAVGALVGAAKAAAEAEKAQRDLATSIRTHGGNLDELLPKLNAQAAAIQRSTGISGDNVTALQAQLAALGVLPENIEAATVASIGWSRTTGKDMSSAAQDVTKALNGKFTALSKLGVKVSSSSEAIVEMARGFELAAAEGQSLEGRVNTLVEDWGDLEEAIGGAVTESSAAASTTSALSATVVQLQSVFASPEGRAAVDSFFRALALGASVAINAGLGALKFWEEEVMPQINRVRIGWDRITGGAGAIAEPLDQAGETARAKVEAIAEDLANILATIGTGGEITLPAPVLPPLDITKQRGEDDRDDAAAARDEARAAKHLEAVEAEVRREIEARERAGERLAEDERRREAEILALAQQVADGKVAIAEANYQRSKEIEDRERAARDAKAAREAEAAAGVVAMYQSAASAVSGAWVASFSQVGKVVDGQMVTAGRAFAGFLADLGKQIAAFLASRVVILLLKLLGGAIAGPAFAGVSEFLGFSKGGPVGYAGGGLVVGGIPGVDSVPIMAQRGEYVLSKPVVDAIRGGRPPPTPAGSVPAYASGGPVVASSGGGGGRPSLNLTIVPQVLEPQSPVFWERLVEDKIAVALRRAGDRGALPFGLELAESTG